MEGEADVREKLLARDAEKRGEPADGSKKEEEEAEEEEVVKMPMIVGEPTFQQEVFNFLNAVGESAWDKHAFNSLQGSMVSLALAVLIVNSDKGWRDQHIGPMEDLTVGGLFTVLGYIAAIFFVLEYLLRLYSCPCDPKFLGQATFSGTHWKNWKWKRLCYATDFTGVVDVVAWLPFFVAQGYSFSEEGYVVWSCIQVLVILKIDRIVPAFTLLDDVLGSKEHGRMLFCTLVVALIAWILFASVLYLIEQHESNMKGSFADMPLSLFFTMILLGGEWCRVDLQAWSGNLVLPLGELTGVALAIFGIGFVGIPVSIFVDAFQGLKEGDEEDAEEDEDEEPKKDQKTVVTTVVTTTAVDVIVDTSVPETEGEHDEPAADEPAAEASGENAVTAEEAAAAEPAAGADTASAEGPGTGSGTGRHAGYGSLSHTTYKPRRQHKGDWLTQGLVYGGQ